nr:hypothetical protein [Tanacetum cinerariifolium]
MATPIDFSKFAMNRIKLDKITKADLVGPVYKPLKETCKSSIKLEYNMDHCYNALTGQLDWTNLEGDSCPYDLSKPIPFQGHEIRKGDTLYQSPKQKLHDLLLLHVQHKLLNLDADDIVDLAAALRMFTRSLVIKKRVKVVQLGVESYHKKLNITKPQKYFPGISAKESYTTSYDPTGIVYHNSSKHKRLMRADELYKFSDRTLKSFYIGKKDHAKLRKIGWWKETGEGLQANDADVKIPKDRPCTYYNGDIRQLKIGIRSMIQPEPEESTQRHSNS